ncbi:MAG: hypothetical protein PVH12_03540, partial [Candidatus Bathyarchaeota archaeon]
MTIKEEILDKLRKGVPFSEIKRNFRSQSKLYEALRLYLLETDSIIAKRYDELHETERKLTELRTQHDEEIKQKREISREVEKLQERKEKLVKTNDQRRLELDLITNDLQKLMKNGIDTTLLSDIIKINERSKGHILARLSSADEYYKIKKTTAKLKKEKTMLEKSIQALNKGKKTIQEEISSETNSLDEIRARTTLYKQALGVVLDFLGSGYSVDDFRSLRHAVEVLGVTRDPVMTFNRLLQGLSRQKELFSLNLEVGKARKKLERLKKAVIMAQSELDTQKRIIDVLEEIRTETCDKITEVSGKAQTEIQVISKEFEKNLQKQIEGAFEDWNKANRELVKLEQTLRPFLPLLNPHAPVELLKTVNSGTITYLLRRVQLWLELN